MHEATEFLRNLALVLCVAAVTTVLFQRLRLPVVFGYLIAGLLVGPHVPTPMVADTAVIRTLADLGVILVMFALGLEFRIRTIIEIAPTGGLVALSETSAMLVLGYLVGQMLGWTTVESLFAGALVAISSTTVVIKAFEERAVPPADAERAFAVLIGEDLIAIFLIAILTAISSGAGLTAGSLAVTGARLAVFLGALVGIGLFLVPRVIRFVVRLERPETTLVASIGICFASALLALELGYSVALGAFIAGALVAESGAGRSIVPLVRPVRDLFAAIFFIAVGMLIEPTLVAEHWKAVAVLTAAVLVGKMLAVSLASFLAGGSVRASVRTGMSLAQIGEFSFIIAGIGLAAGATRSFLYPVAVSVSALTTLATPWLIRGSEPAALFVDRKLPRPLQTFAALYASWLERLRASGSEPAGRRRVDRGVGLVLLDAALLAGLVIGSSLEMDRIAGLLSEWSGLEPGAARLTTLAVSAVVAIPLVFGIVRNARRLALQLAVRALPRGESGIDLAEAPRRALVLALQLLIVLAVGTPLVVVLQPFMPPFRGVAALAAILAVILVAFWRSAANLQGHARAGAEVIVAALEQQMARGEAPGESPESGALDRVRTLLPGLGEPVPVRIPDGSLAAGRTLAQLDLRGRTGATVLAIAREGADVILPIGREVVKAGDILAIAGPEEGIAAARELLRATSHTDTGFAVRD